MSGLPWSSSPPMGAGESYTLASILPRGCRSTPRIAPRADSSTSPTRTASRGCSCTPSSSVDLHLHDDGARNRKTLPVWRPPTLHTTSRLWYVFVRSAAHAGKGFGVTESDPGARRAYARRYYAQNRDKILARRHARKAARSRGEQERDEEQRKKRNIRYQRANLPPQRVASLRAQGRDRARQRRASGKSDYWRNPEAARSRQRRYRGRHRARLNETQRERDRKRYAANRESLLAARRERYASDPALAERTRAGNRAWYERNRDQRREYRRRYQQEHGNEMRARHRERNRREYAKDPRARLDYYKQWRLRNLERARAYVRVSGNKRRAAAAGKHFTFQEWEALLRDHDGRCAYCGSAERIEADHRVPLCRGGSNEIGNILPACRPCNRRKHRRTEDEFRALLARERAEQSGG